MLSVDEAMERVRARCHPLAPRMAPLLDALGRPLAESVASDADSPPFDKALVDGFAVRAADIPPSGWASLRLGEEILAGRVPSRPLALGEAAVIMTGAPLPEGADSVVMHERTRIDGAIVSIPGPVRPGEGRLPRGRERAAGQVVAEAGSLVGAAMIGVLASVGRAEVRVVPRPIVAILPTGDEVVPIHETPGPGQIRETNGIMLAALCRSRGAIADARPAVPDRLRDLIAELRQALAVSDVVLLSGGVSAGRRDLVPEALEAAGVETVFHKVRLKPGKPLLFGIGPRRDDRPGPLVFGLPGNPASGLVGFFLLVGPALSALAGRGWVEWDVRPARLVRPVRHRGDRRSFLPARIVADQGDGPEVDLVDWAGSADLLSISRADGFAEFPEGDAELPAGASILFRPVPPIV